MEQSDSQYAQARLAELQAAYQVDVLVDWGDGAGEWRPGAWTKAELERLHNALILLSNAMGGNNQLVQNIGGAKVRKADIGRHGGEALAHQVSFSEKGSFDSWTVVHEFAHAWDANHGWGLSRQLEKYAGGYTSPVLSLAKRLMGLSDSGRFGPENKPGRYGRKPGCNAAGYFYGDKPGGSNWSFNRLEDFAEAVAMYVGWERSNDLSQHARNRIVRYLLKNGEKDPFNVIDNWADYAPLFYPENGDYTRTRRWQYVDDLVHGKIGPG